MRHLMRIWRLKIQKVILLLVSPLWELAQIYICEKVFNWKYIFQVWVYNTQAFLNKILWPNEQYAALAA